MDTMSNSGNKKQTLGLENLETRLNLSGVTTFAGPSLMGPRVTATGLVSASALKRISLDVAAVPSSGATAISGMTNVSVASYSAISNCQLETRASGQDIGYVSKAGAYVEYQVTAPSTGTYQINLGLAATNTGSMNVSVNGSVAAGVAVPNSYSWDSYKTVSQTVSLAAGQNTLRFTATNGSQYNLNAVQVGPSTNPQPSPSPGPVTTITTSGTVPLASYSAIVNCKLETRASGQDIGYVSPAGAAVSYALNVQTGGTYTVSLGMAGQNGAAYKLLVNGTIVGNYTMASTGSWDSYITQNQTITLPSGAVTLQIASANGTQYNLNAVSLKQWTPTPTPSGQPTISTRNMTSFTELDIVGTSSNDSIVVAQSGSTITVTDGSNVQSITGTFGNIVIHAGSGNETITVNSSVNIATLMYAGSGTDVLNNLTTGSATIVALGAGADKVTGNGSNTAYWVGSNVTVNASSTEKNNGYVHTISSFANGASLTLAGQSITEPTDQGTSTKLTNSSFWGTGPNMADIRQGYLSDCYFLAPLASLASQSPAQLRQMGVDLGDGTYAVQFVNNGTPEYVRVDGNLAGGGSYQNGIKYAHPGSDGNMWIPIFEKAYAFYRTGANSYSSLNMGWVGTTFSDLGVSNTMMDLSADPTTFSNTVSYELSAGKAMALATNGSIINAPLVADHAYSLVGVSGSGSSASYTFRNPWGYDGAGSDANPNDGLVTMNYSQIQQNFWGGAMAV